MFLTWIVEKKQAANILMIKIEVFEEMIEHIPEKVPYFINDEAVSRELDNFKQMFDTNAWTAVQQLSIISLDPFKRMIEYITISFRFF